MGRGNFFRRKERDEEEKEGRKERKEGSGKTEAGKSRSRFPSTRLTLSFRHLARMDRDAEDRVSRGDV